MPQPGSTRSDRRAWQLPRGVSSGTWDYLAEPSIATEYDSFHGDHPLMKLDMQLVGRQLDQLLDQRGNSTGDQLLLADFGCGTARIARHFAARGIRSLNIDLSQHMLTQAAIELRVGVEHADNAALIHSNLAELDWLANDSIDLSVCLFSSVGMIRGRTNRQTFLKHVFRTLKPGGVFLLHVHNRGHSWLDPAGPGWLISTFLKSCLNRQWELGDRVYVYRGLPQMFLHIYSRRELVGDLQAAGFADMEVLPINIRGTELLGKRNMAEYLRAGGFFAIAKK